MDKEKIIEAMADVIHQESCCTSWADAKKMSRKSLKALCKELPELHYTHRTILNTQLPFSDCSGGSPVESVSNGDELYLELKSWGKDD